MAYFFGITLTILAVFLILLVLVQRGRGGGLSGALGGMGGQSAFGTRAGDVFTRITIVTAGVWILLCIASVKLLNTQSSIFGAPPAEPSILSTSKEDKEPATPASTPATESTPATTPPAGSSGSPPPAEAPAESK